MDTKRKVYFKSYDTFIAYLERGRRAYMARLEYKYRRKDCTIYYREVNNINDKGWYYSYLNDLTAKQGEVEFKKYKPYRYESIRKPKEKYYFVDYDDLLQHIIHGGYF